jgi:hypothetical protein
MRPGCQNIMTVKSLSGGDIAEDSKGVLLALKDADHER